MPIYKDTYGYGEFTQRKFDDYDAFIKSYLAIAKAVINKHRSKHWCNTEFHYVDMNAGPGILPDLYDSKGELIVSSGTLGSPLTFTKWAECYWKNEAEIQYRVDFIEQNLELAQMLLTNFCRHKLAHGYGKIWPGDHNIAINSIIQDKFIKWKYGLIYHDPNNGQISFDALRYCAEYRPKYEILINLPGALFKRRPEHYKQEILLSDYLGKLKEGWMVKDLYEGDKHQWTFLLGTDFSQMKEFENIGMFRVNRPKGARIFERVDLSKKQIKKKMATAQLTLPIENI